MERLLTFVKLNSLQICVPWTYNNAMNFSELFKHTGSLCQFSPDGQYLVCNLMFCCPNWNFLHRFQSINLVICLYLTFLVVICISMADIGSKKEEKNTVVSWQHPSETWKMLSMSSQRTHDAKITSVWCQNDVATSFWRHDDVITALCDRWVCTPAVHPNPECE